MKRNLLFCFIFSLTLIAAPVSGQSFLERMAQKAAKKAEEKAQKEAENKAEEQIEKALESGEEDEENQKQGNSLSKLMGQMGMGGEPVPIKDAYQFASSITMNLKSYDKNGKLESDGDIVTYMNPGSQSFAYEFISGEIDGVSNANQKGLIIMDMENKASIILSDDDGSKSGIVYGMGNMMNMEDLNDEAETEEMPDHPAMHPNLKKTGKTKTIQGYKCEEYAYKDEQTESSFWVTKDIDWNSKEMMTNVFKSSMYASGMPWGFMMESESMDKESGQKTIYQVTDINKDASTSFRMSDYQITNLGNVKVPN
jgi:hypothetical protein